MFEHEGTSRRVSTSVTHLHKLFAAFTIPFRPVGHAVLFKHHSFVAFVFLLSDSLI